jgi:ABC-type branched-subunit amino acid transport system substrate-binding protein
MNGRDLERQDDSLKIGALYSLSNGWDKYGEAQVRTHELWADQIRDQGGINGTFDVEIFVEDTAISSTQSVQKAKKLINQHDIDVLLGPNSFGVRQSVSIVTEDEQIPQLYFNPSGGGGVPDFCNEYMFNFGITPSMAVGPEVVDHLMGEYGKDWYILGSDISLSKELSAVIKEEVTDQGGSIKGETYSKIGVIDFSSILDDIASTDPDVIYSPLTANSAISFMKQAERRDLRDNFQTVHFFLSHGAFESADASVVEGALQIGEYFQSIRTDLNADFVAQYQDKYGPTIGPYQYDGKVYHALQLLTQAVIQAGSTDSEAITRTLSDLPSTSTIYGESSIPYDNQAKITYHIGKINRNKQFEIEKTFGPIISQSVCD